MIFYISTSSWYIGICIQSNFIAIWSNTLFTCGFVTIVFWLLIFVLIDYVSHIFKAPYTHGGLKYAHIAINYMHVP